jgi:hypothetical protein
MTVFELKAMLSRYPDDWKVVIDTSTDYEEYSEVSDITPCELSSGFCGNVVTKCSSWTPQVNSILLT